MDKAKFQEMAEVTGIFNVDTPTDAEVFEYLKPDVLSRLFGCPGEPFERYTEAELAEFAAEIVKQRAAESPTVTEAKRQLEQAAQSLTGEARQRWEGMGRTDRNEMVIEVQRGKDAVEVVTAYCVD